jgi:methyl-accepting chemotaxis protein
MEEFKHKIDQHDRELIIVSEQIKNLTKVIQTISTHTEATSKAILKLDLIVERMESNATDLSDFKKRVFERIEDIESRSKLKQCLPYIDLVNQIEHIKKDVNLLSTSYNNTDKTVKVLEKNSEKSVSFISSSERIVWFIITTLITGFASYYITYMGVDK